MNTSGGVSTPPKPPQPALTSALTPDIFTASNIVSEGKRSFDVIDLGLLVIAAGSLTGTEPNLPDQRRSSTMIDETVLPYVHGRGSVPQELDQFLVGFESAGPG